MNVDNILNNLAKSKFRNSFHLNNKMKLYVKEKDLDVIKEHAYKIINERLRDAYPKNDGKQTPMRQVHPVFVAEHATGTCCRGCLERIHHIKKGKELNKYELDYIVKVIMMWIKREME